MLDSNNIKIFNNTKMFVEFTKAENRENIISGENISTILGKQEKWFGDLCDTAFTGDALTITGHHVNTDVPTDAKFTDTTYGVMKGSGNDAMSGLVPTPPNTANTIRYLNESGDWTIPETIRTTLTNPTSSATYYIPFHIGTGTAGKKMLNNNGLAYNTLEGSENTTGQAVLILGNNYTSSTDGNKKGKIRLYGSENYYGTFDVPDNITGNRTYTFPSKSGILALNNEVIRINNLYTGTGSNNVTLTESQSNYDLLIIIATIDGYKNITLFHRLGDSSYVRHPYCTCPNQDNSSTVTVGNVLTDTGTDKHVLISVSNILISGSSSTTTAISSTSRTASIQEVYGIKFP